MRIYKITIDVSGEDLSASEILETINTNLSSEVSPVSSNDYGSVAFFHPNRVRPEGMDLQTYEILFIDFFSDNRELFAGRDGIQLLLNYEIFTSDDNYHISFFDPLGLKVLGDNGVSFNFDHWFLEENKLLEAFAGCSFDKSG